MTFRKFFSKGVIIIAMIATMGLVIVFAATMQAFDSELQATRSESAVKRTCDPEVLRAWALDLLSREADYETSRPLPHPCLRDTWKSSPSIQIRGAEWGNSGPGYVWVSWGSGVLGSWGLAVGASDMLPPPELGSSTSTWIPGIFFWRRLQ